MGSPRSLLDFVGRGGATERVSFSPQGGNEQSVVCDDDPPLVLFGGIYENAESH